MGIAFLAPLFLAGFVALAVPVIIHLVHRQHPDGKAFPSLMFLQQIPVKTQRKQRIRHWLLFLMRCLAIALFVLAFARPMFDGADEAAALAGGGRDLVIVLDRSYSMSYGGRWADGVAAAQRVIDGLGPEDRAALVMVDREATAVTLPTIERTELSTALGRQAVTARGTNFAPGLQLAGRLLRESDFPHREVVLISDFQEVGWSRDNDLRLPDGVRFTAVPLADEVAPNLAIANVTLAPEPRGDREQVVVSARLLNRGLTRAEVEATFELNGQAIQSTTVSVGGRGTETVVFQSALVPESPGRGIVRLTGDGVPADDVFHFVLSAGRALPVLVLEGAGARPNQSLFLTRALNVGSQPAFRVTVKPAGAFRATDLDGIEVVVLNDAPFPGGQAGTALRAFVEAGGGLLVAFGDRPTPWPADALDLLPGQVGPRVDRLDDGGGVLTNLEFGHPVFEVFSAPRSGDFSAGRVYRYRRFNAINSDAVVARFDDGGTALAGHSVGDGRVLVWTTTLDTYWNDLGIQPAFVPFLHETVKYLARYVRVTPWRTVGDVVDLGQFAADRERPEIAGAVVSGAEVVLEVPEGDRWRLGGEETLVTVPMSGFYGLRLADQSDAPALLLAVNVDPTEADLTPLDLEAFTAAIGTTIAETASAGSTGPLTRVEQEQRQGLWWYLLVAALVLFVTETVMSNRLSRVAR